MTETRKTDLKWVWIVVVAGVIVSVIGACLAGGLAGYLAYKWAARDAVQPSFWQMIPDEPFFEDDWEFQPRAEPTPLLGMQSGAVLTEIVEASPADGAGLRVGDVITAVDGREIGDDYTLYDAIMDFEPGDTVTLDVWSHGRTDSVEILLGENPDQENLAWLGVRFTMMDIPDRMRRSDDGD